MKTYAELVADLGDLEVFDASAFVGDDKCPQHVCDFVVALAVAFDDYKDLIAAQQMMQGVFESDGPPSQARGNVGGLHAHLFRLVVGLVAELAELVNRNKKALTDPAFIKAVKAVPASAREMWQRVVLAAEATGPQGDAFGRFIYFARNTVAFHYDAKILGRAFRDLFASQGAGPPFISRGRNMAATRFYFADAAAERGMMHWADAKTAKEFMTASWSVLMDISQALRELVMAFVNSRVAFREPPAV